MTVTAGPSLADVAVVGAGVIGLSTACHLADLGLQVVVIDRAGVAAGASGVQPGGVRQQWSTEVNCRLARESLAFYREIGERLKTTLRPHFTACGYLFVAHSEERLAELAAGVAIQQELGIPANLLSPEEAAIAAPELDVSSVRGAAWCAEDGYFDRAQEPVEAFAEAARSRGVTFLTAEIARLEQSTGTWRVRTEKDTAAQAAHVVVAAACESRAVVRDLGLDLPIIPERRFIFLSDPIRDRLLEPLVVASEIGLAAKQLADGRVLASDLHAEGESESESDQARWRRNVRAGIESLLPRLEFVRFAHLISGLYDVTPDHNPLLGAVPTTQGLWIAAGFSGHGFMIAPAVGSLLARAIAGDQADLLPAEFKLDRFDGKPTASETQIV